MSFANRVGSTILLFLISTPYCSGFFKLAAVESACFLCELTSSLLLVVAGESLVGEAAGDTYGVTVGEVFGVSILATISRTPALGRPDMLLLEACCEVRGSREGERSKATGGGWADVLADG